ncbi:hypothetical protein [Sphingobium boeckii]|uniref:Uncharacterized protein n=1 Tax=Sphingobium boeckii TaxID=1082345 RepID=A0A7W9AHD9_9SPHN|nr:hypothetical protein [Sphingobium boeckii]MBB5685650.1 hypothetical protein [Sphingobium boeckii]
MDKLLKRREDASVEIEEAVAVLGKAYTKFSEATDAALDVIKPHFSGFPTTDGFVNFRDALHPSQLSEATLVGGALFGVGIDVSNIRGRDAWFQVQRTGLSDFAKSVNANVQRQAAHILDEFEAN